MILILFHNTNGAVNKLSDPARVERAQQKFVNILHKYLKSHKSPEVAYNCLHKGVMLVHATQRIYELSLKRLQLHYQ